MKTTKPTTQKDIKRSWHLVDTHEKHLGRIATEIAQLLIGKAKPYFARNMDCGDFVVVINAKTVVLTGNKEKNKVYTRYSGYTGGIKRATVEEVRNKNPEQIIIHAVSGMLPKNKLHDRMLKRLYVFSGSEHSYHDKLKV